MNTQHTPGPWTLKSWHEPTVVTREGDLIASVYADKNRKLIAAAPDLLAALQDAFDHIAAENTDQDLIDRIDAAIARATGQTP